METKHRSFTAALALAGGIVVMTILLAWSSLGWASLLVGTIVGGLVGYTTYDVSKVRKGMANAWGELKKDNWLLLRNSRLLPKLLLRFIFKTDEEIQESKRALMFYITFTLVGTITVNFLMNGTIENIMALSFKKILILFACAAILAIVSLHAANAAMSLCVGEFAKLANIAKFIFAKQDDIEKIHLVLDRKIVTHTLFKKKNPSKSEVFICLAFAYTGIPLMILLYAGLITAVIVSIVCLLIVMGAIFVGAAFKHIHSELRLMIMIDAPLGGIAGWFIGVCFMGSPEALLNSPLAGAFAMALGALLAVGIGWLNYRIIAPTLDVVPEP